MPFWRLYYHLVWATRNREPLIRPEVEEKLYAYLVHKAAELEVRVYAVNGVEDHVHLVVAIPPKHSVTEVVKQLKGASSRDLNLLSPPNGPFAWQRGYGALSVGERHRGVAEAYVRDQKTHHAGQSTNGWLEITAEFDEGPPEAGLPAGLAPGGLREQPARYDIEGDSLF